MTTNQILLRFSRNAKSTITNGYCSNCPQGTVATGKVTATLSLQWTHSSDGHGTARRYYMDYQRWVP
jgi:hypothetical protein